MSRVNKERLGQLLGEIQRHENIDDRYRAALRGETLTGTPGARIRGGGGTSLPLPPMPAKEGRGWDSVAAVYSYPLTCVRFTPSIYPLSKFGHLPPHCTSIPCLLPFESEMPEGGCDGWFRMVDRLVCLRLVSFGIMKIG